MSHNLHNMYEDVWLIGDYWVPSNDMSKQKSEKYNDKVKKLTFDYLNSKYPEAKLKLDDFIEMENWSWEKYGVDFNAHKFEILDLLSKEIFVTEHKFRYPIEQRMRYEQTIALWSLLNVNRYRIAFFFELYNRWLHLHIDRSNLFKSPVIKGDQSFLEKYAVDNSGESVGIASLNNEKDARNFGPINSFMKYIHS